MHSKDYQTARNGLGAPEKSATNLICRAATGTAIGEDLRHVDRGAPGASVESHYAGQLRHQERFLFDVLRQGPLPMRNVVVLGPEPGDISRWLAEYYPTARVATVDPATKQIGSVLHHRTNEMLRSAAQRSAPDYDVAIAVEVFQARPRAQVRAVVERLSAVSRYLVNIDWSEPWPWKTPDRLWCHEYRALYAEAGLNCATFRLPETTNGLQQKLFVASRRMTPEMIRLMNRAEEDADGF